jgi:glycosyltransferase involved in cell wall biosynthesis
LAVRILLLTETIPYPLNSGGRIKTFHTLNILSREHVVHCHAFIRNEAQRVLGRHLECAASLTLHLLERRAFREAVLLAGSWARAMPYTVGRHFDRSVLARLQRACRETAFDAVYCDHLSMMEYARRLGPPVIHDAHNVEFDLLRRYAGTMGASPRRLALECEWRLVRDYERRAYRASSVVLAVSDADAEQIRALAGSGTRVRVLPIPVDVSGVAPRVSSSKQPTLLFVGGLHWPPNADAMEYFARDIWPLVRRAVPSVTLTVVGRDDHAAADRLRRIEGVTLAGPVGDIEPFFRRASALVVPLRAGGGMRVKIVDAMARGVPVVTTALGCAGISAKSGLHLLCADEPRAFADAVVSVLNDDSLGRALGNAGRDLALKNYSVGAVERCLLDSVLLAPAAPPPRSGKCSRSED